MPAVAHVFLLAVTLLAHPPAVVTGRSTSASSSGPRPGVDPATTAANEQYLQPFLGGLAEYRNSAVGKLLVAIADLVDVVPAWLEDLLIPLLLPGSSLTIPLNTTVQLKLPVGHRGSIPLPANFTLASVTLDDLDEIKSLRPAELLPGGNFTWAGIAALKQTTVSVEASLNVLGHPVAVLATVPMVDPAVQFSVVAAFNQSKLCTVWGPVLRSSLGCALWPIFLDRSKAVSGLNITALNLSISDFNATLNISSSGLGPEAEQLLRYELDRLLVQLKPQIIGALPALSAAVATAGSAALLKQLPSLQAQCQPPVASASLEKLGSRAATGSGAATGLQLLNASRVCVSNSGAFLLCV